MIEISLHGLGGQGVVTLTDTLAAACFEAGWQAQAFPFFGPERTGAPVTGFVRLDHSPLRLKQQIYEPDFLVVIDDSWLDRQPAAAKKNARLFIKTERDLATVGRLSGWPIRAITLCRPPAALGRAANMFVLGALLKTYGWAKLPAALTAIKNKLQDKTPAVLKQNLMAAQQGYEQTAIA